MAADDDNVVGIDYPEPELQPAEQEEAPAEQEELAAEQTERPLNADEKAKQLRGD